MKIQPLQSFRGNYAGNYQQQDLIKARQPIFLKNQLTSDVVILQNKQKNSRLVLEV